MKTKQKNKPVRRVLLLALRRAKNDLEHGDPVEAVSKLGLALRLPLADHEFRTIRKAKEEAEMGNPEIAERLLWGFIEDLERPKPKPFKYRPWKRNEDVDGGLANWQRVQIGAAMLESVPEHERLDEREALTDGLTNLLHWCDREKVDFDAALKSARIHHAAER